MFAWLLLTLLPKIEPFLTMLEQFIVKHWKAICICLMIGMLSYQNFSHTRYALFIPTIPYLQDQVASDKVLIKQLQDGLAVAAKANDGLTKTIEKQNSTVLEWKAISDTLTAKTLALQGQLNSERVVNNKKVQTILNGDVPKTCEASVEYLRKMESQLTW